MPRPPRMSGGLASRDRLRECDLALALLGPGCTALFVALFLLSTRTAPAAAAPGRHAVPWHLGAGIAAFAGCLVAGLVLAFRNRWNTIAATAAWSMIAPMTLALLLLGSSLLGSGQGRLFQAGLLLALFGVFGGFSWSLVWFALVRRRVRRDLSSGRES